MDWWKGRVQVAKSRKRIVEFRKFRGMAIKGTVPVEPPLDSTRTFTVRHIDEASWLTAMVESGGKFGCVINYDGTGMTAGIHQAIAVFPRALADNNPKNDQGPLWKLLNRMKASGASAILDLSFEFGKYGMYLADDDRLRYHNGGGLVSGLEIRRILSGDTNGYLPDDKKIQRRVGKFVDLFHEIFKDRNTFEAQMDYGSEHFAKAANKKLRFCKDPQLQDITVSDYFYEGQHLTAVSELPDHFSLAMAMYWSHSVNAPGYALKRLCKQVVDKLPDEIEPYDERISRLLIRKFGDTPFARWDDDLKNGRYQRTRTFAMKYWDKSLFGPSGIMPKDL
jgi:hypothetical protein